MEIIELLNKTVEENGSDLFVTAGKPPYYRKFGEVVPLESEPITAETVDAFRQKVLLAPAEKEFQEKGSFDAGLTLDEGPRFRINFLMQQAKPALVARPVPFGSNLDFEPLNLPSAVSDLADSPRGLILIAGTAGSGKSTTMAAMLNHINSSYAKHIVTIEDPIEFVHNDQKSLITQREVGADTAGFGEALRNVVRESPDVIIIGEMRDLETMQTAITAALTGHLVISTVHTADAVQSVERIINHFPEHLRDQTADDLSLALQGIIAQRLIPRQDAEGMIPAVEIMKSTPLVRKLIAGRNYQELEEIVRHGQDASMVSFTRAISQLCKDKQISLEAGATASTNRDEFLLHMRGMESGIETFREDLGEASDESVINMKRLLHSAVANKGSDLILTVGSRPCVRFDGNLVPLAVDPLTSADTKRLLFSILTPKQRAIFEETREIDVALSVGIRRSKEKNSETVPRRFRVNGFFQRGNVAIAIRVIQATVPPPDALGLPPSLLGLADKKQGLILVTGPTGHGKSTTLASLIARINHNRACHIITVEDPIEYVHYNEKSVIEQREVNADTLSFANALKFVLRQDPDVILVGEMRDPETIAAALTAAETGHLVLASLHTNSAPESINRIIDVFPAGQQEQIRIQLSTSLLGIAGQRLLERQDGQGRVAAFELLIGTHGARNLIREKKVFMLQSVMETGAKEGMITMEKSLKELFNKKLISKADLDASQMYQGGEEK